MAEVEPKRFRFPWGRRVSGGGAILETAEASMGPPAKLFQARACLCLVSGVGAMGGADIFLRYVFPSIGSLLGYAMCVSPLKAVHLAEKKGDLGSLNPIPACVFLANCGIWLMYGAAIKDPFVFVANVLGVPINLHIILRTYVLAEKELRVQMERIVLFSSSLMCLLGMIYVCSPNPLYAMQLNGGLATVVNIGLYAAPLSSLGVVCKTRNSSSIFLPWTVTALGCSFTWFVYGMATRQGPVIVPNFLGVLLNILQLVLRSIFPARVSLSQQQREGSEDDLAGGEQEMQSRPGSEDVEGGQSSKQAAMRAAEGSARVA